MSISVDFHSRAETIIKGRVPILDPGSEVTEHYGVLSLKDKGVEITIYLWDAEVTRKLLNTVRRIDRRLNQCQKKS